MEIVTYVLYGLSILVTLISFIVAYIKAKKSGNLEAMQALEDYLQELIVKAENTFGAGTGEVKLDNVVTKATLYALQNKIKITQAELTNKVNKIVETTNQVNVVKSTKKTPSEETGNTEPVADVVATTTQDTINI